jgi:hypothetical protein
MSRKLDAMLLSGTGFSLCVPNPGPLLPAQKVPLFESINPQWHDLERRVKERRKRAGILREGTRRMTA